jgi:hypothetical protein
MRTRITVLITALALLAPASTALAQDNNPFNGLPPAQPTPAPTVAPANNNNTSNSVTQRGTLYLIGAGLLIVFFGIGWWIARDARRNLPEDERDHLYRRRDEGPHKHELKAKAKARAKGRAQRQARKATRKSKARR